jgi:hypothetical protein
MCEHLIDCHATAKRVELNISDAVFFNDSSAK